MKYAALQGRICICSAYWWVIDALSSEISVNSGQRMHYNALHFHTYYFYSFLIRLLRGTNL